MHLYITLYVHCKYTSKYLYSIFYYYIWDLLYIYKSFYLVYRVSKSIVYNQNPKYLAYLKRSNIFIRISIPFKWLHKNFNVAVSKIKRQLILNENIQGVPFDKKLTLVFKVAV